ncbi:FAD dependent oxidoreductase [Phaeobacter piscinae]|uniref:FAD dependent oxidoreductase n=1 Tax=Phaeobacter piscinae TaxID=1580596 RepID=A0ABM6PG11_9RHOB|nr:FAD-dependent oxidoreductase [Phaeobacter piscinae]ATG36719.1 FAD dependent oxidoreductase [Phaeobacter piscinae]AUQ87240.1 FAD dependent oxidoreductase [Phaeobacter piscinae]AUR25123.1 FAD dependent oxidoreductase [Phaeobacter piscinae]
MSTQIPDVLIIGGGLAGLSAAAALSPRRSTLVLESESALGYHSSGRSAAMFEAHYGPGPVQVLTQASEAHHRINGYLSPRGMMLVAGPDQAEEFAADCATLSLTEIPVEQAVQMVPVLNPDAVGFAAYHDTAEDLDADRLLQDFAKVTRSHGGVIRTDAQVTAIRHSAADDLWEVEVTIGTGTGRTTETLRSRHIVNAAGAWADEIAALAGLPPIGLQPKRRSMARLPAPGGHDVTRWPMIMGVGECWYAKPDAGKLLVSPADADPVAPHDAYADDMVLAEGLARYEEMVSEPVTRVEHNWAGLRSFVADGVPVMGPDPDQPSFVWCAGQGGYGVQSSPAAGRLIADLITSETPEIDAATLAALSPGRVR